MYRVYTHMHRRKTSSTHTVHVGDLLRTDRIEAKIYETPLAVKGVGRHRQGGMAPWPENSFILIIEATKNRG